MSADPRFIVVMNRKAAAFFDLSDMRSRVSSAYVKLRIESRRRSVRTKQPPKHISYVELPDFDVSAHLVERTQTNWLRLLCPSSSKEKKKGGLDLRGQEVTRYLDEESAWSPR